MIEWKLINEQDELSASISLNIHTRPKGDKCVFMGNLDKKSIIITSGVDII